MWDTTPPVAREMLNSKYALEHHEVVRTTISEMVRQVPLRLSYLRYTNNGEPTRGTYHKSHSDKSRLFVSMIYANNHLANRVFKFEGLSDIADMAGKGDYSLSYYLTSG